MLTNAFGQPIGRALHDWMERPHPPRTSLTGRFCRVEPLDAAAHADDLFASLGSLHDGRWTYLPYGPFDTRDTFQQWVVDQSHTHDPLFHAIVDTAGAAIGVAAYMRINRAHGVIEIGHLNFSPQLERTSAATEAMYLLLRRAFDELGYRRYEWKCDSLNEPSRRAAVRFGFTHAPTKACSARRSSTNNGIATQRGTPSPMRSGRRGGARSRHGSRPPISTPQARSVSL